VSAAFNSLPREVQDALLRGKQPEAIRLLRQATGVSLKSSQSRIESVVSQGLPSVPTAPPSIPQPGQLVGGPQLSVAEVATRLIALLRERAANRTNKTPLESTSSEQSSSGLAPGEQPRTDLTNTITWVLVAILLALLLFEYR
jgi:hypothetical protein